MKYSLDGNLSGDGKNIMVTCIYITAKYSTLAMTHMRHLRLHQYIRSENALRCIEK